MTLSKDEALATARDDAQAAYGDLFMYEVTAEVEGDCWVVVFSLADPHMLGGGPSYRISVETGEIVSRRYDQ